MSNTQQTTTTGKSVMGQAMSQAANGPGGGAGGAILAEVRALTAKVDALTAMVAKLASSSANAATKQLSLPDVDLDSDHGDPEVRFLPKKWTGRDYKGFRFSDTDPDFLDMLADSLEFFARKNDENGVKDSKGGPKSKWDRLDAARARGWAERIRKTGGVAGTTTPAGAGSTVDSDIPY